MSVAGVSGANVAVASGGGGRFSPSGCPEGRGHRYRISPARTMTARMITTHGAPLRDVSASNLGSAMVTLLSGFRRGIRLHHLKVQERFPRDTRLHRDCHVDLFRSGARCERGSARGMRHGTAAKSAGGHPAAGWIRSGNLVSSPLRRLRRTRVPGFQRSGLGRRGLQAELQGGRDLHHARSRGSKRTMASKSRVKRGA